MSESALRIQSDTTLPHSSIENPSVRADFRQLIVALLWVAVHARGTLDFRIFRMLVRIEAGFTYLLVSR